MSVYVCSKCGRVSDEFNYPNCPKGNGRDGYCCTQELIGESGSNRYRCGKCGATVEVSGSLSHEGGCPRGDGRNGYNHDWYG